MKILFKPIGFVKSSRNTTTEDFWEEVIADIRLEEDVPTEALNNIKEFLPKGEIRQPSCVSELMKNYWK